MSTPRNHHFVSQIHIKNFFNVNEGKIYLYDKIKNNYFSKTTTKSVFSEKDLNSIYENGIFDHETLEKDLNEHFENDFPKHLETIQNFLINEKFSKKVNDALIFFVKYGIIGEIRNPRHKKNAEDTIYNAFSKMYDWFDENLKNEFDEAFAYKKETKYLNAIQYSKFADEILQLMGDLVFVIEIPENDNDYFLLPDFCAANRREKINEYFNPDIKEIAYVGFPLTSKIYIHFYSTKIKNQIPESGIYRLDSSIVHKLNEMNYQYCESKVACESESYLKKFIKKVA